MITSYKYEGKNIDELLNRAQKELNVDSDAIYINTIEKEQGMFKNKKYILEVIKKTDIKEYIKNYISHFEIAMNIKIQTEILFLEDTININLIADDNAIIIGKDGKNLIALQTIIRQGIRNNCNIDLKINVDVAGYREKRIKNIETLAQKTAQEVISSKVAARFDPMNAYERRIVHNIINNFDNLKTVSIGEEPNRYIEVKYVEKD